jgi:hypothetical protein
MFAYVDSPRIIVRSNLFYVFYNYPEFRDYYYFFLDSGYVLFDPCACKEGVKLDFTKEFVDPREKEMQEIRRVLFSLLPKENSNEEQEEC